MASLVGRWLSFAREYHGFEYVDGEHAFGVLVIEYEELLKHVDKLTDMIRDFQQRQVMQHRYEHTKELMDGIYDQARFAAEEAAQVAAVARKIKTSGFVKEGDPG
jgi:hypothetical protein